ncbi:MAG: hypothetical protein LBV04_09630 [Deferribacteraceae bacterium]|jgi:hypothetical protein|nr:hypothetical protein [Deferribacteraceae bacterium]
MNIIAHRGYWKAWEERNTVRAFERALENDFGIETDIRDCAGKLVVSHDTPTGAELSVEQFFELYNSYNSQTWLALNIKADGLQSLLKEQLDRYKIKNYFVFDMSIPDTIGYLAQDIDVFMRRSEYETASPFYDEAAGIWLDCFKSDWFGANDMEKYLADDKYVCIVSPELHKRPYAQVWEKYKISHNKLLLCTDRPDEAQTYFGK